MSSFNNMFKKTKDKSNRNSVHITDFSLNLNKNNEDKDSSSSLSTHSEIFTQEHYQDSHSDQKLLYESDYLQQQNVYETKDNFQNIKIKFDTNKHIAPKQNTFVCEMCNESSSTSQFIILNCNHIFHINCLAKIQLENAINCQIIDNDTFFNKVKCNYNSEYECQKEINKLKKYILELNSALKKYTDLHHRFLQD